MSIPQAELAFSRQAVQALGNFAKTGKPVPFKSWQGVYHATSKPKPCVQMDINIMEVAPLNYSGSQEDCLYLNIWRSSKLCPAAVKCSKKQAVVVYIHGGAFQWGDSSLFLYDGSNFAASSEVLFVSFNYRVGIFGFLSIERPELPGNMGLWDQSLALEWVRTNIGYFGGDPYQVTLWGQSAGAASVGYHALSPQSRGLFHQIIMQSGTPLLTISMTSHDPVSRFLVLSGAVGCYDASTNWKTEPPVGNLRFRKPIPAASWNETYNATNKPTPCIQLYVGLSEVASVNYSNTSEDCLYLNIWRPASVCNGLTKCRARLPVVVFIHGGAFQWGDSSLPAYDGSNFAATCNAVFVSFNYRLGFFGFLSLGTPELPGNVGLWDQTLALKWVHANIGYFGVSAGREIIKAYFGDYDVAHDDETVFAIMAEAIGDVVFNCPANLLTSKASKQGRGAYKYVFAHRPSFSRWPTDVGVGHADDLPFMLGSLVTVSGAQNRGAGVTGQLADVPTRTKVSPQELNFTNNLLLMMSSFLKTGGSVNIVAKKRHGKRDMRWPTRFQSSERELDFRFTSDMVLNYSNSSEDCLFLNIWRPTRDCGQVGSCQVKLPVVIFLYGGGFQFGDSGLRVYDGRNFAALTDVVFVTLNYRLNIFGFLSADSPALPGNMGLWDQLMAFKWVKKNIGYFGGNPDDITLSGQSAGAIAAGLHSISPLSKGLFNRLIIASGTPLTMILMLSFKGIGKFVDISVALGCYDVRKDLPTQIEEILVCLKKTDAAVVRSTLSKLDPARRTFVPRYGDEILPYDPLEDGDWNINVKDILIGTVQDEGTFMVHALRKTIPYFLELLNSDHSLGISLGLKVMLDIPIASGKEIVKIYFKGYSDNPDNETLVKILSEIIGDAGFVCPTNLFAEKAAQQSVNTKPTIPLSDAEWPKYTAENPEFIYLQPNNYTRGFGPKKDRCEYWRPYLLKNYETEETSKPKRFGLRVGPLGHSGSEAPCKRTAWRARSFPTALWAPPRFASPNLANRDRTRRPKGSGAARNGTEKNNNDDNDTYSEDASWPQTFEPQEDVFERKNTRRK
ncbi:hypothetical protein HPB47_005225 [Ixodes persulcatus]|uniref:Uncharacterized protein n=1 Tax=Ixodes persulcatus TaxID=34615 RepID=A0AC60PDI2_IXOPE|nr:hypothetical protein HPB47_005225 [Ixodes persulcatus]